MTEYNKEDAMGKHYIFTLYWTCQWYENQTCKFQNKMTMWMEDIWNLLVKNHIAFYTVINGIYLEGQIV